MKKVFVTGADGILGSNIVRELLNQNYQVKVFIEEGKSPSTLNDLDIEKSYGNILKPAEIETQLNGCDVVIHAAANTNTWPAQGDHYFKVNVDGTKNMVNAAKKTKVERFLHIGTSNSFPPGTLESPGSEKGKFDGYRYQLDYITSKYKAQEFVLKEFKENQFPVIILDPCFMIGPYDSKPSSGKMIMAIANGNLPGYTKGGRNFVYVGDVAKAIVNAIKASTPGECYILGNENLYYKQIFGKIADLLEVKPPRIQMPKGVSLFYGRLMSLLGKIPGFNPEVHYALTLISNEEHFYDCSKAVTELKMPQTPIDDAIAEAVQWYRQNGMLQ